MLPTARQYQIRSLAGRCYAPGLPAHWLFEKRSNPLREAALRGALGTARRTILVLYSSSMSEFEDEMHRLREAERERSALDEKGLRESVARSSHAVADVVRLLKEAAKFLNASVGPEPFELPGSTRWKKNRTPAGYVLNSSSSSIGRHSTLTDLVLLTADGRLWRWKTGYIDVTADTLAGSGLPVGQDRYIRAGDEGPIVYFNDNDGGISRPPLATWLAQRVQRIEATKHQR